MTVTVADARPNVLVRRLAPLQVAVALQGFVLWVPVEKLFMTQIGFTPRSVAVMAAAYAAVVPLIEVPSGIVADRWSRKRIVICASLALLASSLLGGLSHDVATYIAAAMILGVYFALSSGTVDSMVYDTVLEETGGSDLYELSIGRVRLVESGSFVVSALAGGLLAGWWSPRITYFATLPFVAAAMLLFARFREPRLHQQGEPISLHRHVVLTYRAMVRDPRVRQVIVLAALVGLVSQAVFEFGPLWLVARAAPAALFGPYWAALVATLGIGGYLSGKLDLHRARVVVPLAVATPVAAGVLIWTRSLAAVIVAQAVLALLLAVLGIHAGKLLHDGVSSHVRAGVSSGAGTLSWLLFLPFSIAFGSYARDHGVARSGWFLTAAAAAVMVLLLVVLRHPRAAPSTAPDTGDVACQDLVELVAGYLDGALPVDLRARVQQHLQECDGCSRYLTQIGLTRDALAQLRTRPPSRAADDPDPGPLAQTHDPGTLTT